MKTRWRSPKNGVCTITLDIGANDILQFLGHTCGFPATFTCSQGQIEAEIGHVTANVGYILSQLRAAAPKAKIIFVSQYNPYPTVLQPEGTGDATVEALNGALKSVAATYGVELREHGAGDQLLGHPRWSGSRRHPYGLRLHGDVPGRHLQPRQPERRHPPDQGRLRRDGGGRRSRLPVSLKRLSRGFEGSHRAPPAGVGGAR